MEDGHEAPWNAIRLNGVVQTVHRETGVPGIQIKKMHRNGFAANFAAGVSRQAPFLPRGLSEKIYVVGPKFAMRSIPMG